MKTHVLVLAIAALVGAVPVAQAQWVVVDPTNLIQNTLTAVRTLEQVENQVRQLQHEAQMLVNQARNLANLPFDVTARLRATLAESARLIAQAQGLAFDLQRLDAQFASLYPAQYAGMGGGQMAQGAHERWQVALEGLHTAMQMQAQIAQDAAGDEGVLSDLVARSQSATGALQAMQASNQLLALQAKQSIQTQQLQLTQGRAVALELARQSAAAEQGREVTRRFLGSGTPYTPAPVPFYGE